LSGTNACIVYGLALCELVNPNCSLSTQLNVAVANQLDCGV